MMAKTVEDLAALAYRAGYAAGAAAHVEHHRCERCYQAGVASQEARVAALTAALEQTCPTWANYGTLCMTHNSPRLPLCRAALAAARGTLGP